MTRRLPLCAACGGSLRDGERGGRARIIVTYGGLPGRPSVGWHDGCEPADFATRCGTEMVQTVSERLRTIAARGAGRVVAGSAFLAVAGSAWWLRGAGTT